jgi:hypothetical protein
MAESSGIPADSAQPKLAQLSLERAAEALKALDAEGAKENRAGRLATITVVCIELVSLGALCLHTFVESGAPKVDSTSVALLAVILIAPFVSKLKALELGGAKAEWQEGAATSLKQILDVLNLQHGALSQIYNEFSLLVLPAEQPVKVTEGGDQLPSKQLKHLLWVDDHPEYNAYEVDSLRQFMQVTTVTSNDAAFEQLAAGGIDAIISDIGRDIDRRDEEPGGLRLITELNQRSGPRLPIFYYTSRLSVERYGSHLLNQGAVIVTPVFSELLAAIRSYDEQTTWSAVMAIAQEAGEIQPQSGEDNRLDLIVTVPSGTRIGIEIAAWLRRPQTSTFIGPINQLEDAKQQGRIDLGWLVVQGSAIDTRAISWAAEHEVDLVPVEELKARLSTVR